MKSIKNVLKGFLVLALLVGAFATQVQADNNANENGFLNSKASIKAEGLMKLSSTTSVVMGKEGLIQVMGAKVVSVSGNDINVSVLFGNSPLNFVVKTTSTSKLNGRLLTDASTLSLLKVGDSIGFAGIVASSTSSSIVVNGNYVVSQALYNNQGTEDKNSFQGAVKSINTTDNSFTLQLKSGVIVKVLVLNNTVITTDNVVKTLASLQLENKVKVTGTLNTDGNIITASKVSIESATVQDRGDENRDVKENKSWFGKIRNWFWK